MVPQRKPEPMMTSAAVNCIAQEVRRGRGGCLGQDVHNCVEVAEPEGGTRRRLLARESALRNGGLDTARPEKQPFQVSPTPWIADGNVEPRLWKLIGKVGADGGGLRDHRVPVLEGGHLAHGIDGEVGRLAVLPPLEADHLQRIRLAQLFEHPMHDRGAGGRGVIEDELWHLRSPMAFAGSDALGAFAPI